MLHLKLPTDPRWADIAEKSLEDILTDHAYCEQKAASTCISLIVEYPEEEKLVEVLTPVVAEEWQHFERVLAQIKKRGFKLGKQRKDEYVVALNQLITKGGSRQQRLVDKLLICALIEARSCERFKMLWQHIADEELSQFYYELMASEAGHYVNFIELAREIMPRPIVDARWQEFLKAEAQIIETLGVRAGKMH
ncbi:MAG: tRNA-(ms[2]io[6]A)-hydroxylase [Cytophagales bacterium]|nr:tRNA-(ms[2]io[6]A)-hydroxylase [Bernardetiaceae bacterium]MDW8203894.1 tRNA-(ms[2]io[6]A)-hydroxylase [Cytophagales bacterium]